MIMFPKRTPYAWRGRHPGTPYQDHQEVFLQENTPSICNAIARSASEMFLREHLDVFCTQFTCLHSNSSLHLKCDADYAAE
jgi:hypothetical protein